MENIRKTLRKVMGAATGAMIATTPVPEIQAQDLKKSRDHIEIQNNSSIKTPEQALPTSIEISRNSISQKELEAHREDAIRTLLDGLPRDSRLNYLRDPERLRAESQAYLPDDSERAVVVGAADQEITKLAKSILPGGYGILGYADIDPNGAEQHRIYILQKASDGVVRFEKAYRASMGEKGFGTGTDQTPLGYKPIQNGYEGMYGEVVTVLDDNKQYFKKFIVDSQGKQHHFVSDFGHETITEPSSVVTDRYTIDEARGIHFHGSNRTGKWRMRDGFKVWISFLSRRTSGGCIRMSNTDVRDMGRRYIKLPTKKDGKIIQQGTPVSIFASKSVLARHSQAK